MRIGPWSDYPHDASHVPVQWRGATDVLSSVIILRDLWHVYVSFDRCFPRIALGVRRVNETHLPITLLQSEDHGLFILGVPA